jgi:hypothetical protein
MVTAYGAQVGLPVDSTAFVTQMQTWLEEIATATDAAFPTHTSVRIVEGQPVLRKPPRVVRGRDREPGRSAARSVLRSYGWAPSCSVTWAARLWVRPVSTKPWRPLSSVNRSAHGSLLRASSSVASALPSEGGCQGGGPGQSTGKRWSLPPSLPLTAV